MTDKYNEEVKCIHECIVSGFTEEEEKWYNMFCKFKQAYDREQTLCNYAFQSLAKEEANAKKKEREISC